MSIDLCLNCTLPICIETAITTDTELGCAYVQLTRTAQPRTGKLDYKAHRDLDNYRAYQREYQRERYRMNGAVRERKKLTSKQYRERTYIPVKLRARSELV